MRTKQAKVWRLQFLAAEMFGLAAKKFGLAAEMFGLAT
jgi:hypothetical protein